MLHRKKRLALVSLLSYIVHRSMAITIAAAFLDVSSLNLAVPLGTASFFAQTASKPSGEAVLFPGDQLRQHLGDATLRVLEFR